MQSPSFFQAPTSIEQLSAQGGSVAACKRFDTYIYWRAHVFTAQISSPEQGSGGLQTQEGLAPDTTSKAA